MVLRGSGWAGAFLAQNKRWDFFLFFFFHTEGGPAAENGRRPRTVTRAYQGQKVREAGRADTAITVDERGKPPRGDESD